jgi:hypothetical protein
MNKEMPPMRLSGEKVRRRLTSCKNVIFLDCKRKGLIKKNACYFEIICEFLSPRGIPL